MLGATEFRQSGSCLIAWQGPVPVAQIAWDAVGDGWYINFLTVEQPKLLAPLLAKFRSIWRECGKPTLSFHTSPDNQAIGRLIDILGAECATELYTIKGLDQSFRRNTHEQDRERTLQEAVR